jgi:hypothetical protein
MKRGRRNYDQGRRIAKSGHDAIVGWLIAGVASCKPGDSTGVHEAFAKLQGREFLRGLVEDGCVFNNLWLR